VLSLYEGMIGLDALPRSSPEANNVVLWFGPAESKPVVLAKTFSITKPASA
jgi:hypothetical protein